jgi:hypothetical protein
LASSINHLDFTGLLDTLPKESCPATVFSFNDLHPPKRSAKY